MFVVFAANGPQTVHGRGCFVWQGIPSLADIVDCLRGAVAQGMLVEVWGLSLPHDRVNSYRLSDIVSRDDIHGSYDGHTLTVSRSLQSGNTQDPEILRSVLAMTYGGVCSLYFDIFHGLAEGEHKTTSDPTETTPKENQ